MRQVVVNTTGREASLPELGAPWDLDELIPGSGPWEIEIGFGKGRYLLRRALEDSNRRFLGIEMAASYHQIAVRRMHGLGLANVALIRGEALLVLATLLPPGFAASVHVYFPDPWPKARHHKRRLFDPESVDLVLNLLQSGGELFFATDFVEYGELVQNLLRSHPGTEVIVQSGSWPDGPRTNYEVKYEAEGRPILRLRVIWRPEGSKSVLHPLGARGILAATSERVEDAEPSG